MQMLIKKVQLKNIGPHKDITVEFDKRLHSLVGGNGRGKTFILESIPACFYGSWSDDRGGMYNQVSWGFTGEAYIGVSFDHNGVSYHAERRLKVTEKTTSQECFLYQGDEELVYIAGPKSLEFSQAIENLLGPQDLFMASVFTSQEEGGDLTKASPSDRKAILSSMLGLDKYKEVYKYFKKKELECQNIKTNLEAEVRALESTFEGSITQYKDVLGTVAEIKDSIKEKESLLSDYKKSLIDFNSQLEAEYDRKSKHEVKRNICNQAKLRHVDLLKKSEILKEDYFDNDKCRKCSLMACAVESKEELDKFDSKSIQEGNPFNSNFPSINLKINELHNNIDYLSKQLAEDNTLLIRVKESEKVISRIKKTKEEIEKVSVDKEDYQYIADTFSKNKGGIPALLIDEALPILQDIAFGLLQRATNNKFSIEFSTLKQKKDGDFTESLEIICTNGKGFRGDIRSLSGGEKCLLKLAIRLTLSIFMAEKSNIKYQTLFLDEPFLSLDSENMSDVIALIEEVSNSEFNRLIIVSHDEEILKNIEGRIDV